MSKEELPKKVKKKIEWYLYTSFRLPDEGGRRASEAEARWLEQCGYRAKVVEVRSQRTNQIIYYKVKCFPCFKGALVWEKK